MDTQVIQTAWVDKSSRFDNGGMNAAFDRHIALYAPRDIWDTSPMHEHRCTPLFVERGRGVRTTGRHVQQKEEKSRPRRRENEAKRSREYGKLTYGIIALILSTKPGRCSHLAKLQCVEHECRRGDGNGIYIFCWNPHSQLVWVAIKDNGWVCCFQTSDRHGFRAINLDVVYLVRWVTPP